MSEFYEFDPPKEGDEPQLPPLFNSQSVLKGQDPFDKAVSSANAGDVGTVFYSMNDDNGILSIAVTLGPEVDKAKAFQVHYLMMLGLSDALGALAPPEIEIAHLWPNFMFMNRGLMGKIVLIDSGEDSQQIPSWMVAGVQLRMKVEAKKFHETIEATSFEDEGASFLSNVRIIEAISRHFLSWLNTWQNEGFKPVHQVWVERIVDKISVNDACDNIDGNWVGLDESGLGLFKSDQKHFSLSLEDVNLK